MTNIVDELEIEFASLDHSRCVLQDIKCQHFYNNSSHSAYAHYNNVIVKRFGGSFMKRKTMLETSNVRCDGSLVNYVRNTETNTNTDTNHLAAKHVGMVSDNGNEENDKDNGGGDGDDDDGTDEDSDYDGDDESVDGDDDSFFYPGFLISKDNLPDFPEMLALNSRYILSHSQGWKYL